MGVHAPCPCAVCFWGRQVWAHTVDPLWGMLQSWHDACGLGGGVCVILPGACVQRRNESSAGVCVCVAAEVCLVVQVQRVLAGVPGRVRV